VNLSDVKLPGIPSTSVRQSGSCHCAAEYICRRAPDVVGFSSRCDNYLQFVAHCRRIAADAASGADDFRWAAGNYHGYGHTGTGLSLSITWCDMRQHILRQPCWKPWGKQGLEHIPGIVYRRDGQVMKSAAFNRNPPGRSKRRFI
jgi:hypothetical protein